MMTAKRSCPSRPLRDLLDLAVLRGTQMLDTPASVAWAIKDAQA